MTFSVSRARGNNEKVTQVYEVICTKNKYNWALAGCLRKNTKLSNQLEKAVVCVYA